MNVQQNIIKPKRDLLHIEFLRIIAIYLVLFNHTGTDGFFHFSVATESHFYWLYLFISIFDKIAVPIFFMISGALLLGKDESISDLYRKRILKFIFILFAISLFYQFYDCYRNNTSFELRIFYIKILNGSSSTALWYLYSYIGALVMLPFLRKLVTVMSERDYLYLIAGNIIFAGIIPIVAFIFLKEPYDLDMSVPLFTEYNIIYLLTGYYVEHLLPDTLYKKKIFLLGLLISIICIGICCIMTNYEIQVSGDCSEINSQTFYFCLIIVPCMFVFWSCKYYFRLHNVSSFMRTLITYLGGTTFGVYLFERVLRYSTKNIFYFLKPYVHTFPACLVWIFCACMIGSLITAFLKKIPFIKKFL